MTPHYLGLNLYYPRKPLLIHQLILLLMYPQKNVIRFEDSTVRIEGELKKSRYHEAKHNAVYDMTTKAYKRREMA